MAILLTFPYFLLCSHSLQILATLTCLIARSAVLTAAQAPDYDKFDLDNFTLIDAELAVVSSMATQQRTLDRFTKGKSLNSLCWNRSFTSDGFLSPIDIHNHFQPFGGPGVPYELYMTWMFDHGLRFTLMTGLGQRLVKSNPSDPNCCYYLHCPTYNYTVVPTTENDILNADWFTSQYQTGLSNYSDKMVLLLSATFPSLQVPENNLAQLKQLEQQYPNAFGWVGEINLVKYALLANGFLTFPQTTEAMFAQGQPLYDFFQYLEQKGWPVTIHNDIGCDTFEFITGWPGLCTVENATQATQDFRWWKKFLGIHYSAFFNSKTNVPKQNFRKIQNLKLFDALLTAFPALKVTWAHMGLSKELLTLHPVVHSYILKTFFDRHPNLYADISWNIIAQLFLFNFPDDTSIEGVFPGFNEDISNQAKKKVFTRKYVQDLASTLFEFRKTWENYEAFIQKFGTGTLVVGPTYYLAVFHDILHKYSTRFLTGTDFVASYGTAEEYPGLVSYFPGGKGPGCLKTAPNHAGQLSDTSTINIFLHDEAFRHIVLGENFFRITGLNTQFQAPPVCSNQKPRPGKKGGATVVKGEVVKKGGPKMMRGI